MGERGGISCGGWYGYHTRPYVMEINPGRLIGVIQWISRAVQQILVKYR